MTNETLRTYGRTELALAYNPALAPQAAWQKLKYWIAYNKDLSTALAKTGYTPQLRSFTPKQVALIFEYLGEP